MITIKQLALQVQQLVSNYQDIYLFHHINPDGDCLGGVFGLQAILKANYPNKNIQVIGNNYDLFSYLPMKFADVSEISTKKKRLGIILDVNSTERIECGQYLTNEYFEQIIRIDHHDHSSNLSLAINYDNGNYPAVCQILVELAVIAQWQWNQTAATFFYLGIYTDTNRFLFDSVTDQTLKAAIVCWNNHAQKDLIHQQMVKQSTNNLRIRAHILQNFHNEKTLSWFYMSLADQQQLGISSPFKANFPSVLANIDDNLIWIYFTQEKPDQIRCEFRSNGPNVKTLATKWNGGGHLKASGAKIQSADQIALVVQDAHQLIQAYLQAKN